MHLAQERGLIVRKDDVIEQNSEEGKFCCTREALCGPVGHTSGSILCDWSSLFLG